jgi:hypothetical protein
MIISSLDQYFKQKIDIMSITVALHPLSVVDSVVME